MKLAGGLKPWRVSALQAEYNGTVVLDAYANGTPGPSFEDWVREQSNYTGVRSFVRCDAHPGQGGPHRSRGVYVGEYHGWTLFACTHKSKRGNPCGAIGLEATPWGR